MPDSFNSNAFFNKIRKDLSLEIQMNCKISFEFDKLVVWSKKVLVTCLIRIPNESSIECLKKITVQRKKIIKRFKRRFKSKITYSKYAPHISLGYFAIREYANVDSFRLAEMNEKFRSEMKGKSITFDSISLYGFTDMATFFK